MPELIYPEQILTEAQEQDLSTTLDLTNTDIEVFYANIDSLPNEEYAMIRKQGLGTSDASVVLGVNPYTKKRELIDEKVRDFLTEEELAVGNELAVRKGVDLEPLIIKKFSEQLRIPTYKPVDMYVHKTFPYLKFNYDGVAGNPQQYIPVEIKVVTAKGAHNYNPMKALYRESIGMLKIQPDASKSNISIKSKAAHYGIPAYYYTQLQQQILGLRAPYGYLATLLETSWEVIVYFIPRDDAVITQLILEGRKTWDIIETLKQNK